MMEAYPRSPTEGLHWRGKRLFMVFFVPFIANATLPHVLVQNKKGNEWGLSYGTCRKLNGKLYNPPIY